MSEALSNNVPVTGTFGALKAQDPRKAGQGAGEGQVEYASIAGLAQAAAEMAAIANSGGMAALGSKAASQQLPGYASRERGTSSRAYASNGSALKGISPSTDPTSQASSELKSGSSRHDPSARLEGKVPSEAQGEAGAKQESASRGGGADAGRGAGTTAAAMKGSESTAGVPAPAASNVAVNASANAAVQAAAGATQPAKVASNSPTTNVATLGNKVAAAMGSGRVAGASAGNASQGNAGQASGRGVSQQGAGPANAVNGVAGRNASRGFEISMHRAKGEAATKPGGAEAQEKTVDAQAVRGLAAVLRQKGGNVTLRLAPESLGDLKIAMKLDGTSVWASIEATTETARQLLDDQRDTLRGALEAHGLKVERLEVSAVKPEARDESQRAGVRDHAGTQDSARHEQSALAGEDRRNAGEWGRTLQGSGSGGSAGLDDEAGGAGEMVLTVRGAPVTMWTEPQGQSMRLRVDAVA